MLHDHIRHGREEIGIAIVVAVLHALAIGIWLTWTFTVAAPRPHSPLVLIDIREPRIEDVSAKAGEAAAKKPPGGAPARAAPRPVVARIDETKRIVPLPLPDAPPQASALDAAIASGSASSGTGDGGGGDGKGAGGGGSRPRWIAGVIRDSDYPRAARRAKATGTVIVHFDVFTDGRVGNCRIAASSGNRDLDETTCRLVERRFRYAPATDAGGRAISDVAGWKQTWWLEARH